MDTRFKRILAVTAAILAVYLLLISTIAPPAKAPDVGDPGNVQEADGGAWLIREDGGEVAVFRGSEPVLHTDTRVADLPKADRVRLTQGITVYSDKELKRILEDLCS